MSNVIDIKSATKRKDDESLAKFNAAIEESTVARNRALNEDTRFVGRVISHANRGIVVGLSRDTFFQDLHERLDFIDGKIDADSKLEVDIVVRVYKP